MGGNATTTPPASTDLVVGALPGGLQRTTFFNGMFLTQSDLDLEQRFWRMKRRLTNRALGQGVVWGLRLTWDKKNDRFVLSPGYGLDCCGNDLVVSQQYEVRAGDLVDTSDPAVQAVLKSGDGDALLAVALQYVECPEEPRAIHKDACTTTTSSCSPSRTRETTRLIVVAPAEAAVTPIDAFWNGLQEFKDSLSASELAAIFPTAGPSPAPPAPPVPEPPPPPAPPAGATVTEAPPFKLFVSHGGIEQELPLDGSLDLAAAATDPDRPATLQFELRPRAGWGFWRGTVRSAAASEPLASVRSAIDPVLSWTWTAAAGEGGKLALSVEDLGWAPIFGQGEAASLPRLDLTGQVSSGSVARGEEAQAGQTTFGVVRSLSHGPSIVIIERQRTCFDPLRRLVFLDGATPIKVYPSALVLAAVYAVLAESLRENQYKGATTEIATWLYVILWKTLFGADLTQASSAQQATFAKLVRKLFASWCAGFFYPGPRCTTQHHGVFLGELTVTRAGAVKALDPFARRYVLTGPLLTSWAGLFGIAPFDVIFGRLASTLCCIASIDVSKLSLRDQGLGQLTNVRDLRVLPLMTSVGPVLFATPAAAKTALDARGLTLDSVDTVSPIEFVYRLIRVLTQASPQNATAVRLVTLNGQAGEQIQIVEPVTASSSGPAQNAASQAARLEVAGTLKAKGVAALAAAPLADFVTELALGTPVPLVNDAALNAELAKRSVTSAPGLLALDPEAVAAWVAPDQRNDAWNAAVNTAFAAAGKALDDLTARVLKAAAKIKPVFRRDDLTGDKFVEDVAQALGRDKNSVAAAAARARAAKGAG